MKSNGWSNGAILDVFSFLVKLNRMRHESKICKDLVSRHLNNLLRNYLAKSQCIENLKKLE